MSRRAGVPLAGSYLVLELANRCSLACVHCSVSDPTHPHHEKTGYIDPFLVMDLFEDLARSGASFDTLILFWLGEPLLHPHFGAIYQAALRFSAEYGIFRKVEVHTNATHLTDPRVELALNDSAIPQHWHFSLDASTRETYLKVKGMDRFEKVETQVARFVERKGASRARWPRPVFQFIVGSNNSWEAAYFRQRWEKACREAAVPVRAAVQEVPPGEEAVIFFRQLDCPTPEIQASENAVFRRTVEELGLSLPRPTRAPTALSAENVGICSGFWKSPVISWQGELTGCTRDNLLENKLGSLKQAPFSTLWWGGKAAGRRSRVARGDYAGLPPCATCFIPKSSNYTEITPAEIARHDGASP